MIPNTFKAFLLLCLMIFPAVRLMTDIIIGGTKPAHNVSQLLITNACKAFLLLCLMTFPAVRLRTDIIIDGSTYSVPAFGM